MSFLKSLFGRSKAVPADQPGLDVHLDYLQSLRLPAIALSAAAGTTRSRIGGLPALPEEMPWPTWKDQPLAFLCQIDLGEIPASCDRQGLPDTGMLYFFYNQGQETWGFDPKDAGSWRVLYAPVPSHPHRAAPDGLDPDAVYPEKPVAFRPVQTYPDWQDDRVDQLDLNDAQSDAYIDLCLEVSGNQPAHHLFGHPAPVQGNDMDLECQLVSHGLYCGDSSGYQDPRAKELEAGQQDWVLLLQLDSDDEAGMMWGDCGMLYFWIRKDDLAQGRFEQCWMILQCS